MTECVDTADPDSLIEALCLIGETRAAGTVLYRTRDGRIAWRGSDEPTAVIKDGIRKHQPALVELLSHHTIRLEQAALLEMDTNELLLDEAFGRIASSMGMAGGIEYGRCMAGRSKPN
jgi:hypothetical protein